MPINITMSALSPTMEEGTLAKWHVKEGDSVSSGDVIAEIETDKATMEVEAVDEGTIGKIMVAEGTEGVKVNAVIAVLLEEGEDAGVAEAFEWLYVRGFMAKLGLPQSTPDTPSDVVRKFPQIFLAAADPAHRLRLVVVAKLHQSCASTQYMLDPA